MERRARKKARRGNTFKSVTGDEEEKRDRLSELPDNLIHEIFSFLNIQQAVQTCVLSKRWKRTWASLPYLIFDQHYNHQRSPAFKNFVRRVLSSRDGDCNISKFEIDSIWALGQSLCNRIVNYTVSHNVQHLRLSSLGAKYHRLVLKNNSIKTLKLSSFTIESVGFCFPTLTLLDLRFCLFRCESDFADPFASCPNLKSLTLGGCCSSTSVLKVFKISGPQLANLEIPYEFWTLKLDDLDAPTPRVELVTPKLTSFTCKMSTAFLTDFSGLINLPNLDRVDICLSDYLPDRNWKDRSPEKLINMLQDLHNAQYIKLNYETIELLNSDPDLLEQHPPPFKRMKTLKVSGWNRSSIPSHVKTYLLGNDPYEETTLVKGCYAQDLFQKVQT